MTFPTLFRRLAVFAATLTPAVVFAHPGHEGGHGDGLTWDFVGEALHRLTSPYHLAPAVIVGALAILAWRKLRAKRDGDARK
jgi:hydrogenase/urease accessory protein HupE